jgi:hypothetical protein
MTMLAPHAARASHWKQLQRWGGKFFHAPPIALIWHPLTTIFVKDQLRKQSFEIGGGGIQKAVH